jgi:hypothetical protein
MSDRQMVQRLERRQLLSGTSPVMNQPITEYVGISQQARIAYLPDLTVAHLSSLSAEIYWGDNTHSPASFDRNKNGGIDIIATHEYAKAGAFSISVYVKEISDFDPSSFLYGLPVDLGTVPNVVTVQPAPPNVTVVHDKPSTINLAEFFSSQAGLTFTAKINWGDGNTNSAGNPVNSNGNWQIFAAHAYAKPGIYIAHAYVYAHVKGTTFNGSPSDFPVEITVL